MRAPARATDGATTKIRRQDSGRPGGKLGLQPLGYSFRTLRMIIKAVPQASSGLFSLMERHDHPPIVRCRFRLKRRLLPIDAIGRRLRTDFASLENRKKLPAVSGVEDAWRKQERKKCEDGQPSQSGTPFKQESRTWSHGRRCAEIIQGPEQAEGDQNEEQCDHGKRQKQKQSPDFV